MTDGCKEPLLCFTETFFFYYYQYIWWESYVEHSIAKDSENDLFIELNESTTRNKERAIERSTLFLFDLIPEWFSEFANVVTNYWARIWLAIEL